VSNLAPSDRQFRVDAEIEAVTQRVTKVVTVPKGSRLSVDIVPALLPGFDPALVRSDMRTQLTITLTALETSGDRVAYDETFPVRVLPREMLPLQVRTGEDTTEPAYIYLAAWMTPKAKLVEEVVADAKKHAHGTSFSTKAGADLEPIVKAIFEELKTRGVSFGMEANCTPGIGTIQKTRLPTDVLGSTKAQCLEGPILFATLLEALNVPALIVLTPVHAWVGWEPKQEDPKSKSHTGRRFIDTTGVHDFKAALDAGKAAYEAEERYKHFDQDVSRIVDIKSLRKLGVTPQPY
jgi:hypothetical protein